jgi:hypothetical protein
MMLFGPRIVEAYLEYGQSQREELSWVYDVVIDVIEGADSNAALQMALAVVYKARGELLAYVAAGPLEALLCRHGPAVISDILDIAAMDARVRAALRGVWAQSRMHPEVWRDLQEAIESWQYFH